MQKPYGKSDNTKPVRDIAYEKLKQDIILGELPAGTRIVEIEYSEKMHISRTPLREALRKLEKDGLVEYIQRRGVVVRAFTVDDINEIYTIRNALELLTLPSIIEKATPKDISHLRNLLNQMDILVKKNDIQALSPLARAFHSDLIAISGMTRILRVIESQDEYIKRFSMLSIEQEERRNAAHQEHYQIVDYVEKKDLVSLETLMKKHIERSKKNCLIALKNTALYRSTVEYNKE